MARGHSNQDAVPSTNQRNRPAPQPRILAVSSNSACPTSDSPPNMNTKAKTQAVVQSSTGPFGCPRVLSTSSASQKPSAAPAIKSMRTPRLIRSREVVISKFHRGKSRTTPAGTTPLPDQPFIFRHKLEIEPIGDRRDQAVSQVSGF